MTTFEVMAVSQLYNIPEYVADIVIHLWKQRELPRSKLIAIIEADYDNLDLDTIDLLLTRDKWTEAVVHKKTSEWNQFLSRTRKRQLASRVREIGLPTQF